MNCTSCNSISINGVACHESGCPDKRLMLTGEFKGLYRHSCFECGFSVYSDDRQYYNCCDEEND